MSIGSKIARVALKLALPSSEPRPTLAEVAAQHIREHVDHMIKERSFASVWVYWHSGQEEPQLPPPRDGIPVAHLFGPGSKNSLWVHEIFIEARSLDCVKRSIELARGGYGDRGFYLTVQAGASVREEVGGSVFSTNDQEYVAVPVAFYGGHITTYRMAKRCVSEAR